MVLVFLELEHEQHHLRIAESSANECFVPVSKKTKYVTVSGGIL